MNLEDVRQLGKQLESDPTTYLNNVSKLQNLLIAKQDLNILQLSLQSLLSFYITVFSEDQSILKRKRVLAELEEFTQVDEEDLFVEIDDEEFEQQVKDKSEDEIAKFEYKRWLRGRYKSFILRIQKYLWRKDVDEMFQVKVIQCLMELTRTEILGVISAKLLEQLIYTLIYSKNSAEELLQFVLSKYGSYQDVQYYLFRSIDKVCSQIAEKKPPSSVFPDPSIIESFIKQVESVEKVQNKLLVMLMELSPNKDGGNLDEIRSWCEGYEMGIVKSKPLQKQIISKLNYHRKRRRINPLGQESKYFIKEQKELLSKEDQESDGEQISDLKYDLRSGIVPVQWMNTEALKSQQNDAWLGYLGLDLPQQIFKQILLVAVDKIIPNLGNPLSLSDFLGRSFDVGGPVGLLALEGLFILVTKYGLEQDKFYGRMYGLLQQGLFGSKYRNKYFELLAIFMASSKVPAYTAASFMKKLSRLALAVSPAGACLCMAFIHNIMMRHPTCQVLIHRPSELYGDQGDVNKGIDLFDDQQKNPLKTRAIESSLWELETLTHHASNKVAKMARVLIRQDFSIAKKLVAYDIKVFLSESYSSQLQEISSEKVRQKKCHCKFAQPPNMSLWEEDWLQQGGFTTTTIL
eukprot:TRINITY_DN5375_c0_g1_i1.p1 TRINITY_DN5375_c0_g1~~TRINITY_DN5375_c0_g1_i1.p1  ORF type:complete len:631 (+),score=52.09 TRINITY_DN5375_c0_g1_i1:66-1958(+)